MGELAYITDEPHSATVVTRNEVSALKIDGPITKWGSIPVQMRFNDALRRTLVERLRRTTRQLGKYRKNAAAPGV